MKYLAVDIETGLDLIVTEIFIQPNEKAQCALPYDGRTATEYMKGKLSGDSDYWASDINMTGTPIRIFKCENMNGVNKGYCWKKHINIIKILDT